MDNIIFNYYNANIKDAIPAGMLSLSKMLQVIQHPKKDISDIFEKIRLAEERQDMATKALLKSKLYYFTPCVLVRHGSRKYANISEFTGLLALDFDHLEADYAEEFKKAIFEEYKYIIAAWLSASQHGVRVLVKIPICQSVDEFKSRFAAIESELAVYNGFDPAPKNCILPMFLSHDKNLLFRSDAKTFTKKNQIQQSQPIKQYIISDKSIAVEKIIYRKLNTITDNGHYILRAAAYLMGGYVGAGHMDQSEALTAINHMIDSHWYLSKKPSVYKQTAKDMISKGINQPVYLR